MLEEIDASPNSQNRSIRQKLQRRKSKRRCLSNLKGNNSIATAMSDEDFEIMTVSQQQALAFWYSDEDEGSKPTKQNEFFMPTNDFERFKTENILAAADRSACPPRKLRASNVSTQMFQTCEKLLESQQNPDTTEYLSCEMAADDCFNVQTEWMLEPFENNEVEQQNLNETLKPRTDGEHEDKKNILNDDLNVTLLNIGRQQASNVPSTYNKTKTIAEQILEDFCASLSSSSETDEIEPYFRFRKKRLRTYERRFRRPVKINNTNNTLFNANKRCLNDDAELSDTSSELSVQEAQMHSMPIVEPLALDTSGAVHNNLLNLSAFFTQNLLDIGSLDYNIATDNAWSRRSSLVEGSNNVNEHELAIAPDANALYNLATEIHVLRSKFEHCSKPILAAQSDDLIGFASEAEFALRLAQTIDADAIEVEAAQTALVANLTSQIDFIGDTNNSKEPASTTCTIDTSVFDEDTWQVDADFFVNFKTQRVLKTPKSTTRRTPIKCKESNEINRQKVHENLETQIDVEDVLMLFEQPYDEAKLKTKADEVANAENDDFLLNEWPTDKAAKEDIVNQKQNVESNIDKTEFLADLFDKQEFWNEAFTQLQTQAHVKPAPNGKEQHKMSGAQNYDNDDTFCQPSTSKQAAIALLAKTNSKLFESSLHVNRQSFNAVVHEATQPFMGFSTANAKVIHVSDAAKKKAIEIFAQLPDFPIENMHKEATVHVVDAKESLKLGELNEVNKTLSCAPEKEQHKATKTSETAFCVDDYTNMPLSEWLPYETPKQQQRMIRTPSPVLQQQNVVANNENIKPTSEQSKFTGFQTASSKPINISEKTKKKFQNFFDEILKAEDSNAVDQPMEQFASKQTEKPATVCLEDYTNIPLSEWLPCFESPKQMAMQEQPQEQSTKATTNTSAEPKPEQSKFAGFQTASSKQISISKKSKRKYQNFFDEINKADDLNTLQQPLEKFEISQQQTATTVYSADHTNMLPNADANEKTTPQSKFTGFQTASSKAISISEKAIKKYQNFFDEISKADDMNTLQQPLENIESSQQQTATTVYSTDQRNMPPNADTYEQIKSQVVQSKSVGFQTASSKPITISEKAKQKYKSFFDEISKADDLAGTTTTAEVVTPKSTQTATTTSTIKRKFRSLENTNNTQANSYDGEHPPKMLCKSHTLHDLSKDQTPTMKSVNLRASVSQLPTTLAMNEQATGLIVRRNLLSLSKQRKSRLRQSLNNNDDSNETPVKLTAAVKLSTTTAAQQTPNAAEFYAQAPNAASTPQARFETPNKRLSSAACLDRDFKRINWEQLDDGKTTSTTPARAADSTLDGTLKPLPSPQERIENLSACGDPPPFPRIVNSSVRRQRCLGLSRRSKRT